jgi:DNA modification methylase
MAMKFHPPTRSVCDVCEHLGEDHEPIISTHRGKASSADNFDIHNWYNFTLGYTPEFPDFILDRANLKPNAVVLDPFLGSGTTMVCAKAKGFESVGIEANDFFAFAAGVKLNWNVDTKAGRIILEDLMKKLRKTASKYDWPEIETKKKPKGQERLPITLPGVKAFKEVADKNRPDELVERYISDAPFAKLILIRDGLRKIEWPNNALEKLFGLALSATILPVSNVRYGPGFGVAKPKVDAPVLDIFEKRITRMFDDLDAIKKSRVGKASSKVNLGDSRQLAKYLEPNSVDILITSPPYPGDHEYTKHSRLELMFNELALSLEEFRVIKKRMLRGSTTNIYKGDDEGAAIREISEIADIVEKIDARLKEDGATSGFEKLYTKLIWEYFGGMYAMFKEALVVMKPGASFSLLVSDSHAFKMVHIQTADLLKLVAEKAGFVNCEIELWQLKNTTSHKYKLLENILIVEKPKKK